MESNPTLEVWKIPFSFSNGIYVFSFVQIPCSFSGSKQFILLMDKGKKLSYKPFFGQEVTVVFEGGKV